MWFLWVVVVAKLPWLSTGFNIFDKRTNFISFVRTKASLNPDECSIDYGNGTVFARFPGKPIRKLFYMEGYNIGRKVPVLDGFQTISREIFVYRDVVTNEILNIWLNPFTGSPNEVFQVMNDPIDNVQTFDDARPTVLIPPDMVNFTPDVFIQHPNSLDPKNYSQYSAGSIYAGVELFQYFANLTTLATSTDNSIKMAGSWFRKGQFLPWMQLGESPGCLFYHQTTWKLVNGFDDASPDLMELVRTKYPEYLSAPDAFENKMETSWEVFKEIIDKRRARGDPDIIYPILTIRSNVSSKSNSLDDKIIHAALRTGYVRLFVNGSVYSEILGRTSVNMFNFKGHVNMKFVGVRRKFFKIFVDIKAEYLDPDTSERLRYYKNPFTKRIVKVRPLRYRRVTEVPVSSAFSNLLPGMDRMTVLFHNYRTRTDPVSDVENWAMDMVSVFIDEDQMFKKRPHFYGAWAKFCSWLPWLQMKSSPGEMVWRSNFYRIDH